MLSLSRTATAQGRGRLEAHLQVGGDLLRLVPRQGVHNARGIGWLLPACNSVKSQSDTGALLSTMHSASLRLSDGIWWPRGC